MAKKSKSQITVDLQENVTANSSSLYPIKMNYYDENNELQSAMIRRFAPFADYCQTYNMVMNGLFDENDEFDPTVYEYYLNCAKLVLFVDYKGSVSPDEIIKLTYATDFFDLLSEQVKEEQYVSLEYAVDKSIRNKLNRSEADLFFKSARKWIETLPQIDTDMMLKAVQNIGSINFDSQEMLKMIMDNIAADK